MENKRQTNVESFHLKHQDFTREAYRKGDVLPHRYVFVLTNLCNLKCSFCYQRKNLLPDRMKLIDWMNLADQLPSYARVTFTGGEPLMFPEFSTIFSYVLKKHEANLITNGILLNKDTIDFMLSFPNFRVLSISIDDIGNRTRPISDAEWKHVENMLHHFIRRRDELNKKCLLDIKTLILNDNATRLLDIHKYCVEDLKCDTHVFQFLKGSPIQYSDIMYDFDDIMKESKAEIYDDFRTIIMQLQKVREYDKAHNFRTFLHPKIALLDSENSPRYEDLKFFNEKKHVVDNYAPCMFPWSSVHINADGNLFPCLAVSMGNVKNSSLKEIVFGKRFSKFKEIIRNHGTISACSHCGYLIPKNRI